jgi:hypothetical protein
MIGGRSTPSIKKLRTDREAVVSIIIRELLKFVFRADFLAASTDMPPTSIMASDRSLAFFPGDV